MSNDHSYMWIPSVVLIITGVIFLLNVSSHFRYTPDDTYIYLQYAKNFVQGNGIAFNAGEPTYGITSPLWLFIISAGGIAGFDLYIWAKTVDIVLACAALIVFYAALFPLVRDVAIRICATIAFSLNIWFVRWAGSGMETSLAVVLFILSLNFLMRRKFLHSAAFIGLLGLVRPEGLLFFVLIAAGVLRTEKEKVKHLLAALVLIGLSIVPWFVYAHRTFGTIMPNTALAKAGLTGNIDASVSTVLDIAKTAVVSDGISILVCILGCAVFFYQSARLKNYASVSDKPDETLQQPSLVGAGWIIVLPVFYMITDVNFISRYLLLLTPVILMYAFYFLTEMLSRYFRGRYLYAGILVFTALVMLQSQIVYGKYVKPGIDAFTEGMELSLIPIGRWLRLNTPPETKIFAQDVGAIGYYSERYICDAAGLVSPALLQLQRRGYTHERMVDEKVYTSICGVDYVVYRSLVPEALRNKEDLMPLITRPFPQMGLSDQNFYYYTVYSVSLDMKTKGQGEEQNE